MNTALRIPLRTTPAESERLLRLQAMFAEACNQLAITVQQTRCWNRVALHHMSYKSLREQFPQLGSQMVCNVIYSVCHASRSIYQGRGSPFHHQKLGDQPLPRLAFLPQAPVYFDRHTLSIKQGKASMFTLDGRIHFDIDLTPEQEQRFRHERLRELMLHRPGAQFVLDFAFAADEAPGAARPSAEAGEAAWPDFVVVADATTPPADATPSAATTTAAPRGQDIRLHL